jgi:hypothetical protein
MYESRNHERFESNTPQLASQVRSRHFAVICPVACPSSIHIPIAKFSFVSRSKPLSKIAIIMGSKLTLECKDLYMRNKEHCAATNYIC